MAFPILGAVTVLGAAFEIGGTISEAKARQRAARQNAAIKQMQARELLYRQRMNEDTMKEAAERATLIEVARATGGGGGLRGVLEIKKDLDRRIMMTNREARYKAKMLEMGADIDLQLASDIGTASFFDVGSTILTQGPRAYNQFFPGPGKSKGLPEV